MRLIVVDNTNSNVSVDDNNSNDIHVPMYCEHECTVCNSLFQTNEQDKYTCELCAKSNRIQRERKSIEINRRLCKLCQKQKIGDEFHYIMECSFF
jgi:hypothetical protein